ncbi:MAG: TonB-dependent receptor plug domain-containing protein [Methylococcaceae bacterium]
MKDKLLAANYDATIKKVSVLYQSLISSCKQLISRFPGISWRHEHQRWTMQWLIFVLVLHAHDVMAECNKAFDDLLNLPLEQLLQTDVSVASKVSSDPGKQPASVTVVTHEQLQLSGARTVNEALMTYVPGFFTIEDQDDTIAAFRGLAADNNSKVMMLLNGHNLNAEWFMGPPDAILNSNNFDWIERIEVIRGPGSVTLGQGALLGVINIVTRKAENLVSSCNKAKLNLMAGGGLNNAWQGGMEWAFNDKDHDAYLHVNQSNYDGQGVRREGWASASKDFLGFPDEIIADGGQRLKRTDNLSLFGHARYQQLNFDVLHVDQTRDLYNFYQDRNQLEQAITFLGLMHRWDVHQGIELDSKADVTIDDYTLHWAAEYAIAGGTQENRYGLQEVLRFKNLWQGNTLALGAEYHLYDSGLTNSNGDNFLLNIISPANDFNKIALKQCQTYVNPNITSLKQCNTYANPNTVNVFSFFVEDNYQINDVITLFGGLRYDHHENWGDNVSPRVGGFYYPWQGGQFRVSFQEGFRGAVGLNYSGGFRNDGLLRESNFDKISAAQIPGYGNFPDVEPEKLQAWELAFNQHFDSHWQLENVLFYNHINNIIDFGGIKGNTIPFDLPPIGTDIPGTSNNYWFFKNNQGSIDQLGLEASLHYVADSYNVTVSHAYVDIISASTQNTGSMYITKTGQSQAVPQNVTRLNVVWKPLQQVSLGVNYLFYSDWYATSGEKADGGNLLNASVLYTPWERLELSLNVKNILGENNLYPITNFKRTDISPGTPALEETTFWLKARLTLF